MVQLPQFNTDLIRDRIVLVAVSGGADSVALLRLLAASQSQLNCRLCVGHFDHGLRPESAADGRWVQQLCETLGIPCVLETAQQQKNTPAEDELRQQRYVYLLRTAREHGCDCVATAHTARDQVETILHHIVRGTGLRGLTGIPHQRDAGDGIELVRPLLAVSRHELEAYLRDLGQDWREDSSNQSDFWTRNRIRHKVLPLLREHLNPQVDSAILSLGRQAAEIQTALEVIAERFLHAAIIAENDYQVTISCRILQEEPVAIIRQVFVQLWLRREWPRQAMSTEHWQMLADLLLGSGPRVVTMPQAIEVTRSRGRIVIRSMT